jgi:monoamine oxidase
MSITDWINESVPGGIQSRLGQLLDVAYTIEYGAECAQQSALSLLYLLGYNSPGQFSLFGASNEKYHVRGGNDQIVTALAGQLGQQIEPVLPGLGAAWNGRSTVDFWPGDPFTRGSYAFWQVGQHTRFAGIEGAQEGNAHFCGEHTSIDAQGYLEGAVETGQRAASEVVADLNA